MMEEEKRDLQKQTEKPEAEKKEADSGMILGMCLGLAVGAGIGALTKNLGLWIPIGMCLGLSLGIAFDSQKKKKNGKQDDGEDAPER